MSFGNCKNCGKIAVEEKFKHCSKCEITYYCSEKCQKDHWKIHKTECKENPVWKELKVTVKKIKSLTDEEKHFLNCFLSGTRLTFTNTMLYTLDFNNIEELIYFNSAFSFEKFREKAVISLLDKDIPRDILICVAGEYNRVMKL